ncbi:MAG: hypothetical protein V3V18_06635 [Methylococcales bacterium]
MTRQDQRHNRLFVDKAAKLAWKKNWIHGQPITNLAFAKTQVFEKEGWNNIKYGRNYLHII